MPAPPDGVTGSSSVQDARKAGPIEQALRARIADGDWPMGARLPGERALALEFGVARNTVRRAMSALAEAGLLAISAGRGTVVAGGVPAAMLEALRAAERPVAPADAAELRLLLEPPAAALAAARATTTDLAAIDAALLRARGQRDALMFERADAALHEAIIAACRNQFLSDLYKVAAAARADPRWLALKQRAASTERGELYDREHAAIVAAIHERDATRAHRAMLDHLRSVQASLFDPA